MKKIYLNVKGGVDFHPERKSLKLTFDAIASAHLLVGDALNVADWNEFFDLPAYGSPFTGVVVTGNEVELLGGSTITLRSGLFADNKTLQEIIDTSCVIKIYGSFDYSDLKRASFPECLIVGYDEVNYKGPFYRASKLTYLNLPKAITIEQYAFAYLSKIETLILPFDQYTVIPQAAFIDSNWQFKMPAFPNVWKVCQDGFRGVRFESDIASEVLPSVTEAEYGAFYSNSFRILDFPLLAGLASGVFTSSYALEEVNMPKVFGLDGYNFYFAQSLKRLYMPEVRQIRSHDFAYATALEVINMHYLSDFESGGEIWPGVTNKTIVLLASTWIQYMQENGDYPYYLQKFINENNVFLNVPDYGILLSFDAIANATALVGDVSLVANWNTFFDLPANGTPFTSVNVSRNAVNLVGATSIKLKASLFENNIHVILFNDLKGCVKELESKAFSGASFIKISLPECTIAPGDRVTETSAFKDCVDLEQVYLPKLAIIEDMLFSGCAALWEIKIPFETLTSIGYKTFQGTAISEIFAPNVLTIDDYAFEGCTSLNYDFSEYFPKVTYIGDYAFANKPSGYPNEIAEMPSLLEIGNYTFSGNVDLIGFTAPLLHTIGEGAFKDCISIKTLSLPSLEVIGDKAFSNMTGVTFLSLPSCTNLGSSVGDNMVFDGLSGITMTLLVPEALLTCNGGNKDGDIQYLQAHNNAFVNVEMEFVLTFDDIANADLLVGDASSLEDWNTFFGLPTHGTPFTGVAIGGNSVSLEGGRNITIRQGLFENNPHILKLVDIQSVVKIGESAFKGSGVTRVTFPECIETQGNLIGYTGSFYGCLSLTRVDMPKMTVLGPVAFSGCELLATWNIPWASFTSYGNEQFKNCKKLASIFGIPDVIGDYCFDGCDSLSYIYGSTTHTIGVGAFRNCVKLENLSIYKLRHISDNIVEGCVKLTGFSVEATTMGHNCFKDCYLMGRFTFFKMVNIPSHAFAGAGRDATGWSFQFNLATSLGETTGDDGLFNGITGNYYNVNRYITVWVKPILKTCNNGGKDGDLLYLQANNQVNYQDI